MHHVFFTPPSHQSISWTVTEKLIFFMQKLIFQEFLRNLLRKSVRILYTFKKKTPFSVTWRQEFDTCIRVVWQVWCFERSTSWSHSICFHAWLRCHNVAPTILKHFFQCLPGPGAGPGLAPAPPGPKMFTGAMAPPGPGPERLAGALTPPGPGPKKIWILFMKTQKWYVNCV